MQLNRSRLGWTEVTIFIDDIDEEVLCKISKYADNTKIANKVNTPNDMRSMQRTFDKLVAWANRWEMDFNINRGGGMYIGKRNIVSVPDE